MKQFFFYSKSDSTKEPISKTYAVSRLGAAKKFSKIKQLSLKSFLNIYGVLKYDR